VIQKQILCPMFPTCSPYGGCPHDSPDECNLYRKTVSEQYERVITKKDPLSVQIQKSHVTLWYWRKKKK
jgi:hypothetical protein